MKKLFQLFAAFIALLSAGFCTTVTAQDKASLLYEISGNGLATPSYIFGTMHVIPKKDFDLPKSTKKLVASCDAIAFEVDMFGMSLKQKIDLAQQMMLPNGQTIKDLVTAEKYAELVGFAVDTLGMDQAKFESRFSKLTPFALQSIFVQKYMGKIKSYEQEFYKLSKKKGLEIKELETIDFQLGMFNNLPLDFQLEYFLDVDEMYKIRELINAYNTGDINELEKMMQDQMLGGDEQMDEFYDKLLKDRNYDWIPKINTMLKEQKTFIAVGAGHLGGEHGVVELLRLQGYTLRPI